MYFGLAQNASYPAFKSCGPLIGSLPPSPRLLTRRLTRILFAVPTTLIECVPNFSEGRDPAKVDAIVEAMKLPGVYLLDREMDADHNRCVITLAGDREAIQEAAIRGVGKAAELIDLTQHRGRASATRRRRCDPFHSHRGRHARGLRRHGASRWS